MNLEDRVVVLTGASAGIGRATAYTLAATGCKLVLAARNRHQLQTLTAELIRRGHQAVTIPTDMGDTAQATNLVAQTVETFGTIDVVINNAAVGLRDDIANLKEDDVRRAMDVNYFGPIALIQAALPYLKSNPKGGMIINISSIVGRRAMPGLGVYCAGKAALEKTAESLRLELIGDNVRVCTVYPGVTQTDFNKNSLGSSLARRDRVTGVPPERVAQAIVRAIQREQRDVFVTLFDRTFVMVSALWPWLMDKLLSSYFRSK